MDYRYTGIRESKKETEDEYYDVFIKLILYYVDPILVLLLLLCIYNVLIL